MEELSKKGNNNFFLLLFLFFLCLFIDIFCFFVRQVGMQEATQTRGACVTALVASAAKVHDVVTYDLNLKIGAALGVYDRYRQHAVAAHGEWRRKWGYVNVAFGMLAKHWIAAFEMCCQEGCEILKREITDPSIEVLRTSIQW